MIPSRSQTNSTFFPGEKSELCVRVHKLKATKKEATGFVRYEMLLCVPRNIYIHIHIYTGYIVEMKRGLVVSI